MLFSVYKRYNYVLINLITPSSFCAEIIPRGNFLRGGHLFTNFADYKSCIWFLKIPKINIRELL